ncbi:hypothetical protein BJ508DRAFT_314213 [Ascobolus immersus RN42]|uniref:Uncharacterized protein n=1 Tax=Ascobolus immersus RN42 TaxID=1160509 RepID=A0A3N4HMD4_ASCIM|nr:hypothetical protein BJ508DRAFT_314213 [Ascobolus immersus RN42]
MSTHEEAARPPGGLQGVPSQEGRRKQGASEEGRSPGKADPGPGPGPGSLSDSQVMSPIPLTHYSKKTRASATEIKHFETGQCSGSADNLRAHKAWLKRNKKTSPTGASSQYASARAFASIKAFLEKLPPKSSTSASGPASAKSDMERLRTENVAIEKENRKLKKKVGKCTMDNNKSIGEELQNQLHLARLVVRLGKATESNALEAEGAYHHDTGGSLATVPPTHHQLMLATPPASGSGRSTRWILKSGGIAPKTARRSTTGSRSGGVPAVTGNRDRLFVRSITQGTHDEYPLKLVERSSLKSTRAAEPFLRQNDRLVKATNLILVTTGTFSNGTLPVYGFRQMGAEQNGEDISNYERNSMESSIQFPPATREQAHLREKSGFTPDRQGMEADCEHSDGDCPTDWDSELEGDFGGTNPVSTQLILSY